MWDCMCSFAVPVMQELSKAMKETYNAEHCAMVYYSPSGCDNDKMAGEFKKVNILIDAGVPWEIREKDGLQRAFIIGLFGIDKLLDVDGTVRKLEAGVDAVLASCSGK